MSEDLSAAHPALVEMIRREILDSYDEELEQELEDGRLEEMAGGSRASTGGSTSASCCACNTNWFACRTGCRPRSCGSS